VIARIDERSRRLTIAGVEVARIGLGTNRLSTGRKSEDFLREAVEAGVGMIDTAHLYTGGESERAIGAALSPKPEGVVIATKGGYGGDSSPEALRDQIEQSLERLQTDVIDLYYLHRVDPKTPLEESLGAIAAYREAGKIKEVGVSAVTVEQIEAARRVVPVAAVQNEYNLSERGSDDVVDYCAENGIVFVPYYPLGGRTPARTALAWLLKRSPTTLPIPGTLSIDHLRENLAALDINVTDEEFNALA